MAIYFQLGYTRLKNFTYIKGNINQTFVTMKEVWKKIPNYSKYDCSNMGNIRTHNWKGSKQTKVMKPAYDGSGYLRTVLIRDDGKYHTIKVHRIVGQTWVSNPHNKPEINHINGIKDDNRAENLEWVTRQENNAHAQENGLQYVLKGEEIGNSILKEEQVIEIREYVKSAPKYYGRKALAKKYGVSEGTIKDIVSGKTWRHLL